MLLHRQIFCQNINKKNVCLIEMDIGGKFIKYLYSEKHDAYIFNLEVFLALALKNRHVTFLYYIRLVC